MVSTYTTIDLRIRSFLLVYSIRWSVPTLFDNRPMATRVTLPALRTTLSTLRSHTNYDFYRSLGVDLHG